MDGVKPKAKEVGSQQAWFLRDKVCAVPQKFCSRNTQHLFREMFIFRLSYTFGWRLR
jgi:hypothetical protein